MADHNDQLSPRLLKLLNISEFQKLVDSLWDRSYNPPALAANLKGFLSFLFAAATLSLQIQALRSIP